MSWRAPRGRSTATPLAARGRCKGAYVGWIRGKIDFVVLHPCYLANSAPQLHQCTELFFGDSRTYIWDDCGRHLRPPRVPQFILMLAPAIGLRGRRQRK